MRAGFLFSLARVRGELSAGGPRRPAFLRATPSPLAAREKLAFSVLFGSLTVWPGTSHLPSSGSVPFSMNVGTNHPYVLESLEDMRTQGTGTIMRTSAAFAQNVPGPGTMPTFWPSSTPEPILCPIPNLGTKKGHRACSQSKEQE